VTCEESGSGTACTVSGKDGDGDTFGDALCAQATRPAEDCDDTNGAVNPDASEACNGLDDDCNGKDDVDDGFQLYGTAEPLVIAVGGAYQPSIVWGSDSYGMAWTDARDGKARIYFALVAPDGTLKTTPIGISDPAFPAASVRPTIAWSGTEFAVVWNGFRFQRVSAEGTPMGGIVTSTVPGLEPAITWTGAAWQVAYLRQSVRGIGVSAQGQLSTEQTISGAGSTDAQALGAAVVGSTIGVTWDIGTPSPPGVVHFARTDAALTVLGEGAITPDPAPAGVINEGARVGGLANVFGVAWRQSESATKRAQYAERGTDGSPGCGPLDLDAGVDPYPQAVGTLGTRTSVLIQDGVGATAALELARIGDACTSLGTIPVATGNLNDPDRNAAMAKGPNGYILVWVEGAAATRAIHRRVLGPNLCDAPSG
jgi:hypothetical protein